MDSLGVTRQYDGDPSGSPVEWLSDIPARLERREQSACKFGCTLGAPQARMSRVGVQSDCSIVAGRGSNALRIPERTRGGCVSVPACNTCGFVNVPSMCERVGSRK